MVRKSYILVAALVMVLGLGSLAAFGVDYRAGDYVVLQCGGQQFRVDLLAYNKKVNGYSVLRLINKQDSYGGGEYVADVPGIGWATVGVDAHDAMTGEYIGIEVYSTPEAMYGGIEYGAAVGTKVEWKGYIELPGDEPEYFDRDVWEVVGYEDVSVPYGNFKNAMKVRCLNYYNASYGVELDKMTESDWELSESCSEYDWIVPGIGLVQIADYDYYGEEGPDPVELVSCKINGKVNPGAGYVSGPVEPAELEVSLTGSRVPSEMVSGSNINLSLTAVIKNIGDGACEKGAAVDVVFCVRNVDTDEEIEIGNAMGQSISMLKPGQSKQVRGKAVLPSDLAEGVYELIAVVDGVEAVYADSTINVAEGFVDLGMEVKSAKLPSAIIAGEAVKASIDLNVTNNGNITTDRSAVATIEVYAYPSNTFTLLLAEYG